MYLILTGCAYVMLYPEPTSGFNQKPYYNISYDKAWDTVLEVLGEERVGTVYQVKEKGKIITGYFTQALEGAAVQKRNRWSYTITITQLNENSTKIDIVCKIENYHKGWGFVAYQWFDITDTSGFKKIAHNLERWLYEKIEKTIKGTTIKGTDLFIVSKSALTLTIKGTDLFIVFKSAYVTYIPCQDHPV
jgi:hypothetical protein